MNNDNTILTFSEYADFLRIPSISIENSGMKEAVTWLQNVFQKMNASETEIWDDFGSSPMIMGKFDGKSPRTILIYNHYDVQPIGDLSLWNSNPFTPTVIDNKIYARGISDCKGEIISRLMAIDYLQKNGGLPCNIIFIIEGEEEIGSPNLSNYLKKYQTKIQADVCLWECGWKNENEQLEICCGVKGILSFDLEIKTADQPIHTNQLLKHVQNPISSRDTFNCFIR